MILVNLGCCPNAGTLPSIFLPSNPHSPISPCGSTKGIRVRLPGHHTCLFFTKPLVPVWLALMVFSGWTPVCSAWVGGVVPPLLCSLHTLVSRACFKDETNARDHSCPSVLPHCSLPVLFPALFISFLVPHAAGPVVWLELGEDNLQIHTSLIFNASQVQLRQFRLVTRFGAVPFSTMVTLFFPLASNLPGD